MAAERVCTALETCSGQAGRTAQPSRRSETVEDAAEPQSWAGGWSSSTHFAPAGWARRTRHFGPQGSHTSLLSALGFVPNPKQLSSANDCAFSQTIEPLK
jgi:hypothetical protein